SLLYLSFFTAPAPPDIYTLSLHDALPIWKRGCARRAPRPAVARRGRGTAHPAAPTPSRDTGRPSARCRRRAGWCRTRRSRCRLGHAGRETSALGASRRGRRIFVSVRDRAVHLSVIVPVRDGAERLPAHL